MLLGNLETWTDLSHLALESAELLGTKISDSTGWGANLKDYFPERASK